MESLFEKLKQTPETFNLEEMISLSRFSDRVAYCDATLNKLGVGSSRIVYDMGDGKALKLAKNRKGIAQNEVEYNNSNDGYEILSRVYDADVDNWLWVISELAGKAKSDDFKRLWGVSFKEVQDIIKCLYNNYARAGHELWLSDKEKTNKLIQELIYKENRDGLYDLYIYISDYQPSLPQDYLRIANWGKCLRNGVETLVIIDNGFDDDVNSQYYSKH